MRCGRDVDEQTHRIEAERQLAELEERIRRS
jgi:hypothetical protein